MNSQYFKKYKLPDTPGVYVFKDYRKRPLYIGRATSLCDRVRSYFSADLISTRGPRIVDMITLSRSLTWQETDSVLEAVILESSLIKKYQPVYNIDERDDKSSQYVVITDEEWPRVFLMRARDLDHEIKTGTLSFKVKKVFGPYPESGLIKEAMKVVRKLFPFKDKKSVDARHDSFYRSLGRSPIGTDHGARAQYLGTIKYLVLFFEGKKPLLRRVLEKQMKQAAQKLHFEEAGHVKRLLYAIDHINDIALIKYSSTSTSSSTPFRIEAFDISHMSGVEAVGVMAVSVNGEVTPAEYRKFKLSRSTNNDLAGLAEILSRRLNHTEWPYPNIIVVDGNEVHVRTAENVLKVRRISIPVVAVTKDARHRPARLIGHPELIHTHRRTIVTTNAEAHRFAIGFHRKRMRHRS